MHGLLACLPNVPLDVALELHIFMKPRIGDGDSAYIELAFGHGSLAHLWPLITLEVMEKFHSCSS
jgi:hypothetical protein